MMDESKPPFQVGDICISDSPKWARVPLIVDYPLRQSDGTHVASGTWLYGATDVAKEQWRKATVFDLNAWQREMVNDLARIGQRAAILQQLAKRLEERR